MKSEIVLPMNQQSQKSGTGQHFRVTCGLADSARSAALKIEEFSGGILKQDGWSGSPQWMVSTDASRTIKSGQDSEKGKLGL
jgi:hypothetical protein